MLAHDVNNLGEATTAIMQPEPREGLETALHILPNMAANVLAIYEPAHGSLTGVPALVNFANPMQFICSAIQAGSRLGYQDSAELCAQYLAPIMDAIKFNYFPSGINLFSSADTLPKNIAYSEPRLQPPPGFKDTTVPGIFSPDTPWSHRNSEPGWVVAPGMQGIQVQPATANLLTPASLAELMGGPEHRTATARAEHGRTAECLRREQPAATAVVSATPALADGATAAHRRRSDRRAVVRRAHVAGPDS